MPALRTRHLAAILAALSLSACDVLVGVTEVTFFDASNDGGDAADAPAAETSSGDSGAGMDSGADATTDAAADAPDATTDGHADAAG